MSTLKAIGSIVLWIMFIELLGAISSVGSSPGPWYNQLAKSPYTPPSAVFPIAWTTLYAFLGIYAWSIWQGYNLPLLDKIALQRVFITQMLLNISWSPMFFILNQVAFALALIVAMVILTMYLIIHSLRLGVMTAYLLIPYILWLSFAGYLTGYIYLFSPI